MSGRKKKEVVKKHNGVISGWKFVFACMILVSHFYVITDGNNKHTTFICGAIAVDFFFIVTGVLLAKKVSSEEKRGDTRLIHQATIDFISRKISSVYPYLLFSLILIWFLNIVVGEKNFSDYALGLVDFTFLLAAGLPTKGLLGGVWFLSAMILASAVIYPLQKKLGKTFSCLIAPLIGIFLGGYLIHIAPSMRDWKNWIGFGYLGMYKAFFEISLGCTVYELSTNLSQIHFTKTGKLLLSLSGFVCFFAVVIPNVVFDNVRMFDWIFIILIMGGVTIAFSENTLWFRYANNSLFYYLEKLSVPMYLNNFIPIRILNSFPAMKVFSWNEKCIICFVAVILLSMIELPLVKILTRKITALCSYVKLKIIES